MRSEAFSFVVASTPNADWLPALMVFSRMSKLLPGSIARRISATPAERLVLLAMN